MDPVSVFFVHNIVFVYFFYGLAFFALGLVVLLESRRASEFRFARALLPLALFGLVHGAHEWFEMFQIFAAHGEGREPGVIEEGVRIALLAFSFLCLLGFGTRLLPGAERRPRAWVWQVAALGGLWLAAVGVLYFRLRPGVKELLVAADVLARYCLAVPGSLLAAWALLRERRDFHLRGMSRYGQGLLWSALAFFVYGCVSQLFTRPSLVWPSQFLSTALFLRTFGIPVQLLRGLLAAVMAVTLGSALRAFELEGRLRLARANKARLEAQMATLQAQQRRAAEVEALNVQLQAAAQELSAMVEMARILTSSVDPSRILPDALEQVVRSLEGASASLITLVQPDGQLKQAGVYRHPSAPQAQVLPELVTVVAEACARQQPVGVGWDGEMRVLTGETFAGGFSCRAIAVPLRAKDRLLGGLGLGALWQETPLRAEELNMLNAFAGQIASSLESVQLYQMLQERELQLEDLVRQLVHAQEGERQRIARELHDATGQTLTALALGLAAVASSLAGEDASQAANLVRNLRMLVDQAISELRDIMANLRPAQLDDLGLVPTLRWYVQQVAERNPGLQVELSTARLTGRLPPDHETVLFRVVQEALSNVVRHARATRVIVRLTTRGSAVRLEVTDNGIGFDASARPDLAAPSRGGGWGLVGMRERVTLAGGRFSLASHPGQGTTVVVELPGADESSQPSAPEEGGAKDEADSGFAG